MSDFKKYRFYLAGPMSGRPFFNIPAFEAAAKVLRARGFDITTPVELDSPETYDEAAKSLTGDHTDIKSGETWGTCLARDVKILADELDAVILLPEWYTSKGARLEVFVALTCGKPLFEYISDGTIRTVHPNCACGEVMHFLSETLPDPVAQSAPF